MDAVQVWLIPVTQPPAVLAELAAVLDAGERARAEAFALPGPRARFVAAHGAARHILGARLGLAPGRIGWQRGRFGKPEVAGDPPPARISLSHCAGYAMLAVTDRRPVGVDLQRLPGRLDVARMSARYYPPDEAAYVAAGAGPVGRADRYAWLWARKEACVKAAGRRLTEGLRLPARGAGPVRLGQPGGLLPGPYLVDDLPAPAGFRAAVAVSGTDPYRVTQHRWPELAATQQTTVSTMDSPEQMVVEHA
ncbi:MAG: 4-phosphopantetheinyl transferase [Mycobacteriales bacterium]|jgi:4'-phosphopantetheinyl transferase